MAAGAQGRPGRRGMITDAPSRAAPAIAPRGRRPRLRRLDERASPYLYVAPFFLLFAAFGVFPLAYTLFVSLHKWDLLGTHRWVGLQNYRDLLADAYFWNALRNTVTIWVLSTVPQLALALGLAHVLHTRLRA